MSIELAKALKQSKEHYMKQGVIFAKEENKYKSPRIISTKAKENEPVFTDEELYELLA